MGGSGSKAGESLPLVNRSKQQRTKTTDTWDCLVAFTFIPRESEDDPGRITFEEAKQLFKGAIPDPKVWRELRSELQHEWEKRFSRNSGVDAKDGVPRREFLNLARGLVCSVLRQKCKLEIKPTISSDRGAIFVRVRASNKQLEAEAQRVQHRLEFRPEIDPGFDFWTKKEVDKEDTDFTAREATERLDLLFENQAIGEDQNQLFSADGSESREMWSRRVHALQRIADRVKSSNPFPGHSAFSSEPHLRYLYGTYRTNRGEESVLRTLDRITLTESLMARYLDFGRLIEEGVLTGCCALHDASRGEALTRESLRAAWVQPFTASAHEVGDVTVSSEAAAVEAEALRTHALGAGAAVGAPLRKPIGWYMRPVTQPLREIRAYFGEKVGIYFAFVGFYTFALVVPAVVGGAAYALGGYRESLEGKGAKGIDTKRLDLAIIIFGCFMTLWGMAFSKAWRRESACIALQWGTHNLGVEAPDRPQFRATKFVTDRVNHRRRRFFSPVMLRFRVMISAIVLLVMVAALCFVIRFEFKLRFTLVGEKPKPWQAYVFAFAQTVQMIVFDETFDFLGKALTDWENHRTQMSYEDALILKGAVFGIVNNYGALFYTAVFKGGELLSTHKCDGGDCMHEMQVLLLCTMLTRLVLCIFLELIVPLLTTTFAAPSGKGGKVERSVNGGAAVHVEAFEREFALDEYEDTFDDFRSMIVQFGYLMLFSATFPLACCIALVQNLLEIRIDANKLCRYYRRPSPLRVEDIGTWAVLLELMIGLGALTNIVVLVFTTAVGKGLKSDRRLLLVLGGLVLLHALKIVFDMFVPDIPASVRERQARNLHVDDRHKQGVDTGSDDEDDEESGSSSRSRLQLEAKDTMCGEEMDAEERREHLDMLVKHLRKEIEVRTLRLSRLVLSTPCCAAFHITPPTFSSWAWPHTPPSCCVHSSRTTSLLACLHTREWMKTLGSAIAPWFVPQRARKSQNNPPLLRTHMLRSPSRRPLYVNPPSAGQPPRVEACYQGLASERLARERTQGTLRSARKRLVP
jgi:hypothetical protein